MEPREPHPIRATASRSSTGPTDCPGCGTGSRSTAMLLPTISFLPSLISTARQFAQGCISRIFRKSRSSISAEGVYTDVPAGGAISHGFFYFNPRFLNGYTSNGDLLASWIGREGQGAQAW